MQAGGAGAVFWAFLKLGLTAFGGPIAHLAYFRTEFVERRQWLDERRYADLVALCQFLPGPASSQVGMAIGLSRAGYLGALAAWTGFTLPSAILLVLFAFGVTSFTGLLDSGVLHGLKIAAVAVVALAVLGMAKALAPDRPRATLAVAAAILALLVPNVWGQLGGIIGGGVIGTLLFRNDAPLAPSALSIPVSRRTGILALATFFILLLGLPLLAAATQSHLIDLVDAFYRADALVFGGGHVVLPLLQAELVPPGWIGNDLFLAGYGATQAVPGPLFTFAAYLGTAMSPWPNGLPGAMICLIAIFVPSFLLVFGTLPFWEALRQRVWVQAALKGINAAVVGLLLAALYDPVWTSGILSTTDFALGMLAFLLLFRWSAPPWLVVALCAAIGGLADLTPFPLG